jgi:hypothetical protein
MCDCLIEEVAQMQHGLMLPMCRLAHLRVLGESFLIEFHVTEC